MAVLLLGGDYLASGTFSAMKPEVISLSDYVYDRTRRRLEGLSDQEYLWEPVPGCWTIRPDDVGVFRAENGAALSQRSPPLPGVCGTLLAATEGSGTPSGWVSATRRQVSSRTTPQRRTPQGPWPLSDKHMTCGETS